LKIFCGSVIPHASVFGAGRAEQRPGRARSPFSNGLFDAAMFSTERNGCAILEKMMRQMGLAGE
jgi:hypothetical protein